MKIIYLNSSELDSASFKPTPVVVAMPYTDHEMAEQSAVLMAQRAGVDGLIICVQDEKKEGFVKLANRMFSKTNSVYFAYVAQDAYPGRFWLNLAINAMGESMSLLAFNDGKWAGKLAAFGLVRRSWAAENYQGDLFYGGYQQHYDDAELTLLAMQKGVYVYEANSVLVEVDWNKDRKSVHAPDRQLFLERSQQGFDEKIRDPRLLKLFA